LAVATVFASLNESEIRIVDLALV